MTERQLKAQRENARKPRIPIPHAVREEAVEKKADALGVLLSAGLAHILDAIRQGPGEILFDDKGNALETCVEQFGRFKWACEFIGDRCGLSKRHETAIEAEGMPPIEVRFNNFPRPADS